MSTPQQVVDDFLSAINSQDLDAAMTFVAEDCYYDNVPLGDTRRRETMRKILASMFVSGEPVMFEVHRQVAAGNAVMNERTDRFTLAGTRSAVPVAGVFEVNDGKITFWRDYFDRGMMTAPVSAPES